MSATCIPGIREGVITVPDLSQLQSLDLQEILDIVQNPTSNLTAAALIGAAIIVVLLILVVLAWMFLLTTEEHPDEGAPAPAVRTAPNKVPRQRRKLPVWVPLVVALVVLVGLAGLNSSTGRDTHCLTCHESVTRPETIEVPHARCIDCHERPSALFFGASTAARIRMEASRLGADNAAPISDGAIVENSSCLKCHPLKELDTSAQASAEASGSVGIVMSHSEPVAAGMRCTECHGSVGAHVDADADGGHPTMRLCIDCHNGQAASADCATCHVADPAQAVRAEPTPVAKTRLEKPTDCTGCHGVEECDACHGIRLPHSEEFIKGGHGYEAAFGKRKAACSWCHQGTWCLEQCHPGGNWNDPNAMWSHPPDWATRHAQFKSEDCTECHAKQLTCEFCHDR